jgi:hypothetical protein
MQKLLRWGLLAALTGLLPGWTAPAVAEMIRVSQESSPGAGDFDSHVLGYIQVYNAPAGESAADFYNYMSGSYGNTVPTLTLHKSAIFFVNTTQGLDLFWVHDKPNAANAGGHESSEVTVSGDPNGARYLVFDDDPGQQDTYNTDGTPTTSVPGPSGTDFTMTHDWVGNTDGSVIGSIDGNFTVLTQFTSLGTDSNGDGLTGFNALSADGSSVGLNLQIDDRVRFDLVSTPAPAPAGVTLLGIGVASLSLSAWLRRKPITFA